VQPGVAIEETMPTYVPPDMAPVTPSAPGVPDPQFRQIELATGGRVKFQEGGNPRYEGYKPEQISFDDWLKGKISGGSDKYGYLKNISKKYGYNLADALDLLYKYEIEHPKNLLQDPNYTINRLDGEDFYKIQFKNLEESGVAAQQNPEQEKYMLEQGYDAILKNYGLLDSTPEVPTIDPFSGQQVSAQDQTAFTQPQAEIFPQQELPTVTPEVPFQPYVDKQTSYDDVSNRLENVFNNPAIKGFTNFITGSGNPFQDINQFTPSQQSVINQAIENAAKEGRTNITYADYPQTGIAQIMNDGFSPMEYVKTLGSSIIGNPVDQIKTTLGQFGYDPQQQQIKDDYDFQNPLQNKLGTVYPININVPNPTTQYPGYTLADSRTNYQGATQVPYGQTPAQTYSQLKDQYMNRLSQIQSSGPQTDAVFKNLLY
jgi:hypothetical protein